ncbi:MAG: hypothetical protein UW46_C0010G0039 [Candidatus Yanofskybacteria bacterium GW2011_GWF1_44_227]|uniref:SCP domain-containing protein n=1 Tax=Candidatus Yanofskybacteria bacterium GW2011_GWE2_40_11 TaxID=1619033 RepID=A0A0G0SYZ6_9BACT|nr:MAG: hypothetical protein UT69_C0001G0004 [Candidatus Yanofskybacteria bacterium GW2011_GWE1_40_10]KKR40065.1 MAG: hypothetical protein UT75_C0010G0004 [Candidatus Yanofskybacteria bacterium GW2011_GWE2_40_11]KKT15052.1 MAG: hypothetical protein UV97_C0012G0004 [Candidatus Yanofskybacteria bacterium GW2011_GWF2_43_596]KKT52871.1 MAG: hypothetical protein UW46_C0010G0039 [Candidatus Yanofskybacteria bacterium GW2011_GWF1_44_227]OGN35662.1 MAG: hypothetical protein A2207_03755 [Candidatus Yano
MIKWPFGITEYLKDFFIPSKNNNYQPKSLGNRSFFIILSILVAIKLLSIFSFYEFLGADIFNQVSQSDLLALTNDVRRDNGVPVLNQSVALNASAQMKLADMFDKNYFAHESPSNISPWNWFDRAKYSYSIAGENLAMNFVSTNEVVKAWINSGSHKKNLLYKDFVDTGIAVGSGKINGQNTIVVVQHFGKPLVQPKSASVVSEPRPIVKASTAAVSPKPKAKPTVSSTPEPVKKISPISLLMAPGGQVKDVITTISSDENNQEKDPAYGAYYSNVALNDALIAGALLAALILILKIFVVIKVQYPRLILRGILLLVISLALIYFKDYRFLQGNIIISTGNTASIQNQK